MANRDREGRARVAAARLRGEWRSFIRALAIACGADRDLAAEVMRDLVRSDAHAARVLMLAVKDGVLDGGRSA